MLGIYRGGEMMLRAGLDSSYQDGCFRTVLGVSPDCPSLLGAAISQIPGAASCGISARSETDLVVVPPRNARNVSFHIAAAVRL